MRKFIILLTTTFLLLININRDFSSVEAAGSSSYRVSYEGDIIEPVEPKSITNVSGRVYITSGPSNNSLRLKYELFSPLNGGMNRSYASGYVSSLFNYPNVNNIGYNFNINDTRQDLAREGILVRLGIYDTANRTYINYIESTLYDKKSETISIDDIAGDLVYDKCLNLSNKDSKEIFNFSNYSHILENEYYLHLDMSSLSFKYKCYKPFEYREAYLTFNDEYNLFPYINNEGGHKKVPLKAINNNGNIYFGFQNLYVEPTTFSLSSYVKEGYKQTSYFYLPKNKLIYLQGLSLSIHIFDIGVNKISFSYIFSLDVKSLLLGPCNESMFCIVGGVEL